MLTVKLTNCRECALTSKLIDAIDCQLAKMASNLYANISYMLDKPVEACTMSTLLHYKRILTFKNVNEDWASDYDIDEIASRVNVLTIGCKCCNESNSGVLLTTTTTTTVSPSTTTTTTTIASTTTTTTTTVTPLTAFSVSTSTTSDYCTFSDLSPYDNTLYHDGIGSTPTLGDTVYEDAAGTIPHYIFGEYVQKALSGYLITNPSGVVVNGQCL